MRRAKVEPRGAPGLAVVVDIRRASYFPTQDEAKELAEALSEKELAGSRRVAFVVEPGVPKLKAAVIARERSDRSNLTRSTCHRVLGKETGRGCFVAPRASLAVLGTGSRNDGGLY